MPFNDFTSHRPATKAYFRRKRNLELSGASASRRATDGCDIPPLDIAVQAMQL